MSSNDDYINQAVSQAVQIGENFVKKSVIILIDERLAAADTEDARYNLKVLRAEVEEL